MLRGDAEQAADLILGRTDIALDADDLQLHVEPRRLLLVDGRGVGLTVLIEGLLGIERGLPKTVGLDEDVKLAVEQLEIEILLGDGADEVGAGRLLGHLSPQQGGLGSALLIPQGTEHIHFP